MPNKLRIARLKTSVDRSRFHCICPSKRMILRLPYLLGQCGYFGYSWKEARKERGFNIAGITGTANATAPDMPSPVDSTASRKMV